MSIILKTVGNMSEADKSKLGTTGTKINTDGAHLLTIVDAYEITWESQKGIFPSFVLKCENSEGKTVEWSAILKQKVGKDKNGNVRAGEYSVDGVKVYLDDENAEYDNLRAIGQINNLWKICGLDVNTFGQGIQPGTVTFKNAGEKQIERWSSLIGKQFTGITSFIVTLDADGKKAWRNQELNMAALFNKDRLSQAEIDTGKTEPVAIESSITSAKADAKIEYKNRNNKICIQELQLIKSAGKVPKEESVTQEGSKSAPEDIF